MEKKFQFLAVFTAGFIKAFTGQYALTHRIIRVDENNYFKTPPSSDKDYRSEMKDPKTFDFIYDNTPFQIV